MEFHEYRLSKNSIASPVVAAIPIDQYYFQVDQKLRSGIDLGAQANLLLCEIGYVKCRRPFYHVYPAVQLCLENTKLDFELKQIGYLKEVIAMCFAVGKEPSLGNGKVASMLVELATSTESVAKGKSSELPILRIVVDRIAKDGTRCFSSVTYNRSGLISEADFGDKRKLISLAVGVSLIAQDERFAEPILLKRDQGKQFDKDGLERAIERAKNRGRNGVSIGKGLEF